MVEAVDGSACRPVRIPPLGGRLQTFGATDGCAAREKASWPAAAFAIRAFGWVASRPSGRCTWDRRRRAGTAGTAGDQLTRESKRASCEGALRRPTRQCAADPFIAFLIMPTMIMRIAPP